MGNEKLLPRSLVSRGRVGQEDCENGTYSANAEGSHYHIYIILHIIEASAGAYAQNEVA